MMIYHHQANSPINSQFSKKFYVLLGTHLCLKMIRKKVYKIYGNATTQKKKY